MEVSWSVSARAVVCSKFVVRLQRSDDIQMKCQYEEWLTGPDQKSVVIVLVRDTDITHLSATKKDQV